MKTNKPFLLVIVLLATSAFSTVAAQGWKPIKGVAPRSLVADLYRQHKKRSPFFQRRSRALLDKYFARELADLLWRDAHSSGDEVGALDGDPLFNAQDMDIKNFSIGEGVGGPRMVVIPVTFENLGEKHEIKFRVFSFGGSGWKIANIEYDDGSTLLDILKRDRDSAENRQSINIYLVAVGDDGKAGKKIGCGDSLIAVTRTIEKTAAPLTVAIRELLQTRNIPALMAVPTSRISGRVAISKLHQPRLLTTQLPSDWQARCRSQVCATNRASNPRLMRPRDNFRR